jgi:hypothetical protein
VHQRQVAIKHHDVVVVDAEPLQRGVPVVGHVDRERLPAQPFGDAVGQDALVFDHQNAQPPSSPTWPARGAPPIVAQRR